MKKPSPSRSIMKFKNVLFLLILFISVVVNAQSKQVFENPELKTIISTHKVVAIMPYRTSITYKRQPKNFSAEANRDQEKSMSKSIQSSMYTFLLRKAKNYNVSFQDVDKTNILLKKAGMLDKLDEFTNDEIAKVLGVDAIIGGVFETEQTKSEAGAIASAILFGGFGGKTGTGTLTMTLNNGSDGELLWRFFKTMDQGIMASTDDIVESMMRKVSRNFPYAI
ncbi:hypothetical protein QO200_00190 [Flavobacterium sp. Arc3]|uniref:hypothetical protein n=1 Tax=Flavobacterium sp. Arc3 TaxID=3046686 RepID=UPI00352FB50E